MMALALLLTLLTMSDIRSAIQKHVCDGCEFKILGIWIPGKNSLDGFESFELFPRDSKDIGRRIFDVMLRTREGKVKWGTVFVWVERYEKVAVLNRDVSRGDVLTRELVSFRKVPATTVPPDAITESSFRKFEGKIFTSNLRRGKVLRKSNLQEAWSVKRGQKVKIIWRSPYLYIEAPGLALDSGKEGDRIRVRNLVSGKIVWGKIFRGTVLVSD